MIYYNRFFMLNKEIIAKLKESGLVGRGGAGFPAWQKWQAVKESPGEKRYIVCNGSEGEPMVFKDKYILENYPAQVVEGIKIALSVIANSQAYIYLNQAYYQQFKDTLEGLSQGSPISLFAEPGGYLAGEETTLLNIIEGKIAEPRLKPPFPAQKGLWGQPTLINNVETFYWVSKISRNQYHNSRFYCITGDAPKPGVYERPENYTIEQVLKETGNWPSFDFFCQAGGGASGAIMLSKELNQSLKGTGSIIIFNKAAIKPMNLLKSWANFYTKANCDRCLSCREGIYRLNELLASGQSNPAALQDILAALEKTSLCPLGKMAALPFKTALEKLF
jgi:NADH:ubiquinone oxidoreductase subunit F (NADH-binding)